MLIGILSRKIDFIPLFIGDILYSVLIYFGFCFLFPTKNRILVLLFSILFCFTIEISQLIQWNWLYKIRSTTLGHYILGKGFLWTDLLCYSIGTIIAYIIEYKTYIN
ncbi:DUF2809 domain-containing protein [Flavobacterium gelidilacus]|jgi:hypothetical protein|uniref:ribosomal maturation YjgA family protein n=1 Tax=Flavobacterium gelidilacus TaxID=206041 RepID=UPI000687A971|nr:DUF2809 domain-containing protein [Flavobacterium gelidilacus]